MIDSIANAAAVLLTGMGGRALGGFIAARGAREIADGKRLVVDSRTPDS